MVGVVGWKVATPLDVPATEIAFTAQLAAVPPFVAIRATGDGVGQSAADQVAEPNVKGVTATVAPALVAWPVVAAVTVEGAIPTE